MNTLRALTIFLFALTCNLSVATGNSCTSLAYMPSIPADDSVARYPGGDSMLTRFLNQNLIYPKQARDSQVEGKVSISFLVRENGELDSIRVVHVYTYHDNGTIKIKAGEEMSKQLSDEALRLVKLMGRWQAAEKEGKPVKSYYVLPVGFKLNAEPEIKIHIYVEEMPSFPGGMAALQEFLYDNINYPRSARDAGVEGKIIVRFVVDSTGKVGHLQVIKAECFKMKGKKKVPVTEGEAEILSKEALRVVSLLPDFIPGRQDGKAVSVYYNLPLSFVLEP